MSLPRSGPVRSEAARQAVLRATVELLAERGYDHLTIEGIAARAGVGKQTVYRWWSSKSDIIAESMIEGLLLPDRLVVPDTGDIRRDLRTWLATVAGVLDDEHGQRLGRSLVTAAADNPDIAASLDDRLSASRTVSARLAAAAGQTSNLFHDAPVEMMADMLLGTFMLRVLNRASLSAADIDDILTVVLGPATS